MAIFETAFTQLLRSTKRRYNHIYPACAMRYWLRPTSDAIAVRERLRPSWVGVDPKDPLPTIGIHIRATAFKLATSGGDRLSRYGKVNEALSDMGLGTKCAHSGTNSPSGVCPLLYTSFVFNIVSTTVDFRILVAASLISAPSPFQM